MMVDIVLEIPRNIGNIIRIVYTENSYQSSIFANVMTWIASESGGAILLCRVI